MGVVGYRTVGQRDGAIVTVILTPDARLTGYRIRIHDPRVRDIKAAVGALIAEARA